MIIHYVIISIIMSALTFQNHVNETIAGAQQQHGLASLFWHYKSELA